MTPVTSSRAITKDAVPAWAHEPGNLEFVLAVWKAARAGGFEATEKWVGRILRKMEEEAG